MSQQASYQRKLRKAERHLQSVCPKIGAWVAESGKCVLQPEWEREPMEALIRAVAHQQLHGKAAEAILGRLIARFPKQASFPDCHQILKIKSPDFRALGFSEAKMIAIQGIARAAQEGTLPTRAEAEEMSDEELIESLTELRGIGRWTVEMFLIFTLGRMDIMPVDDFGVKAGLMHLCMLKEMPKKKDFPEHTDAWAPYRSIGAWYLWRLADARKQPLAKKF